MKVGFIGTGEIAEALIRGVAGQGHHIWISNRGSERAKTLSETYNEVISCTNEKVVLNSDIVFICLMSPVASEELPKLVFRKGHQIISVMAHTTHKQLREYCYPTENICITIPLPFIAKGGCPLPVFPRSDALETLYGTNNPIIVLKSSTDIAPHFVISATLSPIFTLFEVASKWLTERTGADLNSEIYVTHLFKGYLDFMPDEECKRFQNALKSLSTEGGLNSTLKTFMRDKGAYKAFADGLDAFRDRLGICK
jgi:pyrroline-5-carboxylate reductase